MTLRRLSLFGGAALAALALAAAPGFAQEGSDKADKMKAMFDKMDRNGDGKLDYKEVRGAGQFEKDTFDKYDTDHDGFLTPAEMKAGMKAHPDKTPAEWRDMLEEKHANADELTDNELKTAYEKLDLNHDGKVEWKEAEKTTQRDTFDKYDGDGDGSVTIAEFETQYAVEQAKKGRKVAKNIADKVKATREADASFAMGDRAMESLDKDKDGSVSNDELIAKIPEKKKNAAAQFKPLFDQADANHDKKLDKAEWSAFQTSVKEWTQAAEGPTADKIKNKADKAKDKGRP